jgi:septum formation protein
MRPRLVLASASPRRRDLLSRLLEGFDVEASNIPEVPNPGEAPDEFAKRAALEKALDVARRRPRCWVLGADTVVVVDGEILSKPADAADAARMLTGLSGRSHQVITAVALVGPDGQPRAPVAVETVVRFRHLERNEIQAYASSQEPLDKAGAYAVQGGAAAFVEQITGSYTNVVGLPLDEVAALLRDHGLLAEESCLSPQP